MPRVVNRLSVGSLGVDSLTGSTVTAPSPGYTSQRDTASSIAVEIIHDHVDEEDGGGLLKNSLSPPDDPLVHTL